MIKREISIFLIVGTLTVIVDFLSYQGLIMLENLDVNIAKGTGFMTGTLFAYFANRVWTFGHKPHRKGSIWRFLFLYTSTLGTNVLINSFILHLFAGSMQAIQIAFLVATGVSASLNFLGMKHFVFKSYSFVATQ